MHHLAQSHIMAFSLMDVIVNKLTLVLQVLITVLIICACLIALVKIKALYKKAAIVL